MGFCLSSHYIGGMNVKVWNMGLHELFRFFCLLFMGFLMLFILIHALFIAIHKDFLDSILGTLAQVK